MIEFEDVTPCRTCQHQAWRHAHYRPGSDCGSCSCPALNLSVFSRLRRLLGVPRRS